MIILSAIVASLPDVLANEPTVKTAETIEPLERSTGSSQDLQGLEAQENKQWSWDIEESDGIISENIEYTISPNVADDSPVADVDKEDEDWENSNRGDPKKSGGLVPFAEF